MSMKTAACVTENHTFIRIHTRTRSLIPIRTITMLTVSKVRGETSFE
jgi:hypothetical protein